MRKKKPKSVRYIVGKLKELKALRYWKITGSKDVIRLRAPKTHQSFAKLYVKAINDWLKVEGVMSFEVKVCLVE